MAGEMSGKVEAALPGYFLVTEATRQGVEAKFGNPPAEYGQVAWWGWEGPVTEGVIERDLDRFAELGFKAVLIEPGYDMAERYLSDGWFRLVRHAVLEARRRGMRVWAQDEGKYPSGFAGGKFSQLRPDLRVQALEVAATVGLGAGKRFYLEVGQATVGAVAVNTADQGFVKLDVSGGAIDFTAPAEGTWEVRVVEHRYRSVATVYLDHPTHGRDDTRSLLDFLKPEATDQFIAWVHDGYRRALGEEFGKTFQGLMSDESHFAYMPWTEAIEEVFAEKKGYEVRPYLGAFFASKLTEEVRRVQADYRDVWSDMFRDHFFSRLARWCRGHGVQYITHLKEDNNMPVLARQAGCYFKVMRDVEIPGVDTVFRHIWPGKGADFPKYASSAAHVFGKPRCFSESFAGYWKPYPTTRECAWVINQQFVRGINQLLTMYHPSAVATVEKPYGFFQEAEFPALVGYVSRLSYVLAQGRPAAEVAVYYPTSSLWLEDGEADGAVLKLARMLLEAQRDFDFIDEQALGSDVLTLTEEGLVNLSGQSYRVVLVPSAAAITEAALEKLRAMAAAGFKVVFMGRKPGMVAGRTYKDAAALGEVSWAVHEPEVALTEAVLAALPGADLQLGQPNPGVKYLHRRWQDAHVYFLFNEAETEARVEVTLQGRGEAEEWDAYAGTIRPVATEAAGRDRVQLKFTLPGQGTRLMVVPAG